VSRCADVRTGTGSASRTLHRARAPVDRRRPRPATGNRSCARCPPFDRPRRCRCHRGSDASTHPRCRAVASVPVVPRPLPVSKQGCCDHRWNPHPSIGVSFQPAPTPGMRNALATGGARRLPACPPHTRGGPYRHVLPHELSTSARTANTPRTIATTSVAMASPPWSHRPSRRRRTRGSVHSSRRRPRGRHPIVAQLPADARLLQHLGGHTALAPDPVRDALAFAVALGSLDEVSFDGLQVGLL